MEPTIFMLDDDPEQLEMIMEEFERNGIKNYHPFNDHTPFIDCFKNDIHIAILDHYLGGVVKGFDILEKIIKCREEHNIWFSCYFIVMSGTSDPSAIQRYVNYGPTVKFIGKNDEDFMEQLIGYVKRFTELVREEYAYHERQMNRLNFLKELKFEDER